MFSGLNVSHKRSIASLQFLEKERDWLYLKGDPDWIVVVACEEAVFTARLTG